MIPIPVGIDFCVEVHGRTYKHVVCEKCGERYSYEMERVARSNETSWFFLANEEAKAEARQSAEEVLQRRFARDCDPVPCPQCGWFQGHMISAARQQYRPWMRGLGRLVAFFAVLLAIPGGWFALLEYVNSGSNWTLAIKFAAGAVFTLLIGLGAIVGRICLSWGFDPNKLDQQKRINYGRRKTVKNDGLEQTIRESIERRAK